MFTTQYSLRKLGKLPYSTSYWKGKVDKIISDSISANEVEDDYMSNCIVVESGWIHDICGHVSPDVPKRPLPLTSQEHKKAFKTIKIEQQPTHDSEGHLIPTPVPMPEIPGLNDTVSNDIDEIATSVLSKMGLDRDLRGEEIKKVISDAYLDDVYRIQNSSDNHPEHTDTKHSSISWHNIPDTLPMKLPMKSIKQKCNYHSDCETGSCGYWGRDGGDINADGSWSHPPNEVSGNQKYCCPNEDSITYFPGRLNAKNEPCPAGIGQHCPSTGCEHGLCYTDSFGGGWFGEGRGWFQSNGKPFCKLWKRKYVGDAGADLRQGGVRHTHETPPVTGETYLRTGATRFPNRPGPLNDDGVIDPSRQPLSVVKGGLGLSAGFDYDRDMGPAGNNIDPESSYKLPCFEDRQCSPSWNMKCTERKPYSWDKKYCDYHAYWHQTDASKAVRDDTQRRLHKPVGSPGTAGVIGDPWAWWIDSEKANEHHNTRGDFERIFNKAYVSTPSPSLPVWTDSSQGCTPGPGCWIPPPGTTLMCNSGTTLHNNTCWPGSTRPTDADFETSNTTTGNLCPYVSPGDKRWKYNSAVGMCTDYLI